jgi:hypothetical protein
MEFCPFKIGRLPFDYSSFAYVFRFLLYTSVPDKSRDDNHNEDKKPVIFKPFFY